MRGSGDPQEVMLAVVNLEERVPKDHPLRTIKTVADEALERLSPEFDRMYSKVGRASVPPERLLKASLLISLYSVLCSESVQITDSISRRQNDMAAAIHKLLQNMLAIEETTPYHCSIEASSATGRQRLQGDVTFQVENKSLRFNFFADGDGLNLEANQLFAMAGQEDATTILTIPSQGFEYAVRILTLPHPGTITVGLPINRCKMRGVVTAEYFGSDLAPLTNATMWFENLPSFRGKEALLYKGGIVKPSDDQETPMGFRVLGYMVLNARGWSVTFNEIPREMQDSYKESHMCVVKRGQVDHFTARELGEFLKDLLPFLSFAFGRDVSPSVAMGNGEPVPVIKWGITNSQTTASHAGRNWYLLSSDWIDIRGIFQRFCELPEQTRIHWRKVIQTYVASEEIANILGRYQIAEAVSLSSLEGLTKSIINTYERETREQCLDKDFELKHTKDANGNRRGVKDAIELVAKRELGSTQLNVALERITKLRNTTVHLDLNAEEDLEDAYFRWQNCQALVEVIMLATLKLKEIPNRTQPGTFEVMGNDMLWRQRSEAIHLYQ